MTQRLALIDGDIILWKVANACQTNINFGTDEDPQWVYESDEDGASMLCRKLIAAIKNRIEASKVLVCLSPTKTKERSHSMYWRHDILPSYKANRKGKETHPLLLHGFIRDFLMKHYPCMSEEHLEADDLLGIYATDPSVDTDNIICSVDKDFKQIPGTFYNTMYNTVVTTSEEDADLEHFMQMLTGDTVDNYKGCPGIGPKKATKLMDNAYDIWLSYARGEDGSHSLNYWRWVTVVDAFHKAGTKKNPLNLQVSDALIQARVSRILRYGEYDFDNERVTLWSPPND